MQENARLAVLLIPVMAFAESCLGIGLFVSGLFLVLLSSAVLAYGLASIEDIILLAMLGALLGDHLGFYVGRKLGPGFHQFAWVQRNHGKLEKTEALIRRSGKIAIFIGRFVPAIRSLIPAALGLSDFPKLKYSILDSIACLLWACALGLIISGAAKL